jgi:small-conductance mechanosensitive channel
MPQIVYDIIDILASLIRFLGMAVFGLGMGWLALDLLKKSELWQVQIAVFLGLAGLVIALSVFSGWAAVGAVAAGIGVAIVLWGLPKKEKKEEKPD